MKPIADRRFPERAEPPREVREKWLLLWDGECGFCRRTVEGVLKRDRLGLLAALPYQDCLDWLPAQIRECSARQAHLRSPAGRYWGGGAAFTRIVGLLGHPVVERFLAIPVPAAFVECIYRSVAAHRGFMSRFFSSRDR